MRAVLGAVCAAVLAIGLVGSARAEVSYPYCAMSPGGYGGASDSCGFVSMEQCRQTISGNGGWCQANPRYSGTYFAPEIQPRRGRSRAHPGS